MYGPSYSNSFDNKKKQDEFFSQRSSFGPVQPEKFFSQKSSFGPNPHQYKNVIQTERNNVSISVESNEILNTNATSNLAARFIGSLFLGNKAEAATVPNSTRTIESKNLRAIDADTFNTGSKDTKESFRLFEVDAPETSVYDKYNADTPTKRAEAKKAYLDKFKNGTQDKAPSKTAFITQDFSIEAKKATQYFLNSAKKVQIIDKGKDAYDRNLASIQNEKGENLSDYLVEQGLAYTQLPSSKYFDGSSESYRRYEKMVEAYQNKRGMFSKDDFVDPSDFRKGNMKPFKKRLDTEIRLQNFKSRGIANNEYAYILADEDTYFTISSSLGASAHYGASLESNLMKQAGYNNMSNVQPYKGMAESLMEYNNEMLGNKPLSSFERFVARAYDSGLSAGGVGNWLNREVFMPRGWGRVYKDEKGALPSIAGLVGKILDESYLYYANMNPNWTTLGHDYKSGTGYSALEDQNGMFQTIFEDTASFGLAVGQSLAMYVAITQPLEMLGAQISKSFIDRSIEGTIIDNTLITKDIKKTLNKSRNFAHLFMAEFYFGDLSASATKPGGLLSVVLEQKMHADAQAGKNTFFNHEHSPGSTGSGFKAQLLIGRGRAKRVLEGTFKPFLIDIVNPFNASALATYDVKDPLSPTGTRQINSYDKFNRAVNKLISVISSPVDLNIKFKAGSSLELTEIKINLTDIPTDIKLGDAKAIKGGVVITKGDLAPPINNYTDLSIKYKEFKGNINKHVIGNNEELFKLLTEQAGMSDYAAKSFIFVGGDKKEALKNIPEVHRAKVEFLIERKTQLNLAKEHLQVQLGSYADKIEVSTTNTGIKYKTNIAAALQDMLDMTPLNPLKWGLFNASAEYADEFLQVGQVFSFRDAADYTERLLTGQTKLSAIFAQYEAVVPDVFQDGVRLNVEDALSNKIGAKMASFDNIVGAVWKNIKSIWNPEPKVGPDILKLTKDMRKTEVAIFKAAEKLSVTGFRFHAVADSINAARNTTDVIVGSVDEAGDLLDSVIEYSHAVRTNGQKVISITQMGKSIESAGLKDVTGNVMRNTNKFSGNIKIEDALGKGTGYIAAAVFLGLALNNIMQSTKGASITTQIGLALYGENEDIAVKYEANRILPTEVIATALNLNQTGVNLAADTIAIAGSYAIAHKIAKQMTTVGYMPYTFDLETVQKMATNEQISFLVKKEGVLTKVDADYLKHMLPGHDSFVYVNKKIVDSNGRSIIKKTVLTKTNQGFKTEKILQEFAENVPTKAFIFGSIMLLATNGLRQGAASIMQAMSESASDKVYIPIFGGLTLGGFAIGAFLDGTKTPKALEQGVEVAKAAGQVSSKQILNSMFSNGAAKWAVGGAMVGAAIWMGKLVLDPNVKQKGSLDPLIAGVGLGIGVGIFKRSAGLGLAAGLVAMSAMAALNWAGIRVFELGRAGKELDPENLKLVTQLSQFSTAVLESEKDNTAFMVGMAAYAGQFSSTKSILAKDGGVATETQVIAQQSPLPVLQFFVAEKIEGRRGEIWGRNSPDGESTVRTYTLGIQSGALLGTSISVELPVSYTPGKGFLGFTYNSENNLMAVPDFAIKVGVWAALATSSVGIMYNMGAWISNQGYNMTGQQMFKTSGANFARHADDLFSSSKFMINAAEKISSYFIRTTVGIFSTLQGTNASMAYEAYKNSVSKTAAAANMMQEMQVADLSVLSPEDAAKLNSLDDVSNAKNFMNSIQEGEIIKYAGRSKHLFVGAILGMVAGGFASDIVKHFKIKSSLDADASFEVIQKIEEQEEKRKMLYLAVGGSAGAIANDIRSSTALIKTLYSSHKTAVVEWAKAKNFPTQQMQDSISRVMGRFGNNSNVGKFKSAVLNNKIANFVLSNSKLLGRNKFVGIFIAASLFNFARTSSEFGIASMMDRHVVYDNKGNAYKDHELQTDYNIGAHIGVASLLGAYYTGIMALVSNPNLNQRETILKFAQQELASMEPVKTKNVINKITSKAGDILFSINRIRIDKESTSLLKSLLSVDNEFVEYENYLEAKVENPNLKLPQNLEKIQDVLKLRAALGKEELKEFIALKNQKQAGVGFDFEEQETYKKFLSKLDNQLTQTTRNAATGEIVSTFDNLTRGFKVTSNLTSFSKRATAFIAVAYISKKIITTVGNQGGEIGVDSYLDQIYNRANATGKMGQRRPDGSVVGLEGGLSVTADFLRIISGRDIVNLSTGVDELNGKMIKSTGQRLVGNAKDMNAIQRNVKDLSQMLVIDNPNAYIATLNFGGKTLRNGDKGVTTSSYFQLQGPAQDISTATYSMSAKFIFTQYSGGQGRLGKLIDNAFATFKKGDKGSYDLAAVNLRNATSMMDAMKTSRTYSKNNSEISAALAGDSVAAGILAARQEALAHIAWQPTDSLFTNMFFETMDKAKHRYGEESFVKFLEGIAKSDVDVLEKFANLMEGGLFENFFRKSSITNVMFFTGSAGKPPKKSGPQMMATDISNFWQESQSISVQTEMFEQNKIQIFDSFMDKVIMPLSSHSIFAILPNWMKIGGLATATLGLTAVVVMNIAQYTETKTRHQSITELLDVFGSSENTVGPKVELYPNDMNKLVKELNKNISDGQKRTWYHNDYDNKSYPTDIERSATIIKGEGIEGVQSRYVGLLNIGKDGKPLHVRFELNPYLDYLDATDHAFVVETLGAKGDNLRTMFNYVETNLDENGKIIDRVHSTVHKQLLETNNVKKWLEVNSTGKKFDSVYDIFKTSSSAITKDEFIGAAVNNFQEKFSQGLDNLLETGPLDNASLSSYLSNKVMVNGEQVLVQELLNPDFKVPGLDPNEFGPAVSNDIRSRQIDLRNERLRWKDAFQKEIQIIVEEEYRKIEWKGKATSVEDDAIKIAEANRKALIAIKTKIADPNSTIGAITRGAGLFQPTDIPDQQNVINNSKSKSANRPARTITVDGKLVDEFVDGMGETLHYSRPIGNIGFWDSLAGGGKGLMVAGATMFDVLTGLDMLGAFLRVAEIQNNPFATNVDKQFANKELGRAILSSTVGLGIGMLGGAAIKGMGALAKSPLFSGKNVAKTAVGLLAGGAITGALWKDVISPGISKLSGATKDNNILGKGKEAFDGLWFKAGDAIGQVAAAPIIGAYNMGEHFGVGSEAAYFTGGFMGGTLAAGTIIAGSGLLGSALAGTAAIGATAISLPILAAVALGIGLIVGVGAIFGGKKLNSGMVYASREVMKIPVVGTMTGLTDPYRAIRNQERFKHNFQDSPFLNGYVGDIVNSNWLEMLSAAENPGGRDTVALLFGEVLAQGEGTAINISAWKLNAADSMIGGPKPIIDEVIGNELRIRAETYSDSVIGRYTWDQLVDNSDNSDSIRAMEAAKRADRVRIIQQARAKAMKATMDAGGVSQALKVNNPRKAALTQQQMDKVDQVYKDLDTYGKPSTQVTAASLTTHKSNTENSILKFGDKTKKQMVGNSTTAPTKHHVYKGITSINNKSASVTFVKEADPMNLIYIKEAQTMGANTVAPIDQQNRTRVYNAYKNDK